METTNAAPQMTFEEALEKFLAHAQRVTAEHFSRNFPALLPTTVELDLSGRRYVRVVSVSRSGTSRSCLGFVDRRTGDCLKADGWKGPARNYPRGNVYSGRYGFHVHGIG